MADYGTGRWKASESGGALRPAAASTRPPVVCYRNAGRLARDRKDEMQSTSRRQCSSMLRVAKGVRFCAAAVTEWVPNTLCRAPTTQLEHAAAAI